MIPVLFKGNETNFNHNGIGLLKDTLSCEVSEIRNGSFDLELVYPITGPYFKDLKNGNIIQAKPNDTDQPHNFRITEIDKTLYDKEVVVYGVSTTNDLGGNMVKSLYLTDVTPQVILNEMKNALHYPTTFNFVSNITTIGRVDWSLNNPLNLIVGEEGSLVDIFGGEVKRTNDTLFLYGRRGKDNVTTIRAGKNLNGFKMTESFQGKYTQILPYFKYEAEIPSDIPGDTEGATTRQEFTVFGSIVSSPYHGRYPVNAIKPIDFSQNELVRESKSLDSLNSVASKYFSNLYSEIDKPSVSINVDMIQLVDSEQYALYEKLEKIELTDTVSVYVSEYDVDVLVKITELKYDSLRERTISIVASSSSSGRTSLMDEISGSYKQFTTTLVDDKIQSATSGIINQILTQKNGSNMYAGRATPPENSKPGDIWFKDTGGGDVELYEFDGVNWVRKMYKGFGDDVRQLVDDKIAESNALFTGALEEQEAAVEQANALAQLAKTTATNASLSASAANQDAQKALADAANAKTEALAQFSMVSQALDTAKTNLQNQVSAADSKAVKAQADVDGLKVKADTIKNDLDTAKTNLQNQVSAADSKAVKAQADANALRTDLDKQAQTISAQAQAQTALTNRVTTVETLADGTKTTVVELSKTVDKATGDITSVTNRTKVVEDGLAGVKTNYTQLSQTVNTQTGQIQTINSKTANLQSGIDGVNQRFENLRIGATNYIIDFGFANINQFKSHISLWTFERISDSTARSGYHIKATCTKAGTHGFSRLLRDLRGTEWQGRKMTYSIDIKASKSVRMKLGVEAFSKSIKAFDVTTDWQRFISTDDVNFKNFYTFPFYSNGTETWDVGDVIYLRDPQLEDGTVATTPRAAEEDLRSEIAEYKRTADKNYAGLQSTVTTLDDKVTQNKTEVNQTATQLSNRLTSVEAYKDGESTRSQAYFEASKTETAKQITAERTAISANYVAKSTYDENVSGTTLKLNEVKTTADTTKQNLATYQETVNRKLTELTTSDQTLDGKITAASTKVDTVAGQIRTEISTVEGKIPTTIGATNYIIDFGFANINQFKSHISLWTFERISDSTARSGYHIKATCTKAGTHGFSRLLRDLRGTEWQGRKMTYSIDIKASKSVRMKLGVEAFSKSIKAFDVTTDWQRFISTDDVNFKNFYTFPFYSNGTETWDVGDVIYLRDPQLEDGTVATTPRAAEEDLKTDITSIKTTITQTSQGVEQLTTSLATTDGKVTTAETKINQLIGDVSSKVSQTDYNTLTGRVTNAESNISQQATQIASKVSQTDFNSEKTKISNLQTSVTQQADQIALKANQTELNNLTGRMSTAEGKITTQAGLIELKAAKTDLTPITNSLNTKVDINQVNSAITAGTQGISQEVTAVKGVLNGGISARNYAVGTGIPSTHSVDSRIETYSMGYVVKQVYSTYKNATLRNLGFKVGDKYTVIFDIYAENNTAFRDYRVEGYNSGYSHIVGSVTNTIGTPSSPTQFVGTTTITEDAHLTAYRWMIRFDLSYFNVTVKNFRIFKGEIKQDWYPAWEDQEAALEATKSRVDITEQSITSLVSGSKTLPDGRTSVFATKIESLEGAITQRVTTQELNNKGYQTATDVTNTINGRTDLARKTDIPKTSGGRNLAQKTSSEWSTPYTSFYGTPNNCPNLYKIIIDDLAVGDTLKSRIVLQYTDIIPASGKTAAIYLQGDGNITGWGSGGYHNTSPIPISGSGEMIFEHGFKITDNHLKNEYLNWMFRTDYIASGSLQWRLAKVEKGPLWTAWTPAPEDAEADLTDRLAGYVTNQTYTTYTTARQQTDQQITEQINQTVSKVPTGPVNLIVNGFDPQTISPWTFDGNGHNLILATHDFFYNSQKKLYMLYTNNTNEGYLWTNVFNLKRNTKYTIRLGLFAGSATKSCDIYFMGKPSGGSFSYQLLRTINDLSPSKVVYYTITFDSGSFDLGQFRIDNNGSWTQGTPAALYICEVSCIEGEYNNSWTPSFDELITEQKFNETKSTVDAFSRAIGTRDETGFVPNIARLVMTQDAVISEVAKYGEHNNNLVQDSVRFSTTIDMNGSSPTIIEDGNITWRKSGATTNTWAGIGIPVNVKRFISGEKYTLSFEYYLYQSPDADIYVEIKDHTNNRGYCYGFIANTSTPIKTYRYFQQTFTINTGTASNTIVQDLYFYLIKNGNIGIRNVMLVRGEKIGPYSTSQVDSVTSRVEQTANSYSVKFLNNANDITTQLNLTSSGARIKSSLIHLDGNVTVSGTAWMDGAIIKNLSADKITTGTLNANNVNITNLSVNNVSGITSTYLQSVIGDAFIDWMRGKRITAMNGNMSIDLLSGNITLNSGSNSIKRIKGTHTAFVHFNDVNGSYDGNVGSLYAAIGVTSSGDGVNSMSSGRFAGLRAFRAASGTEHTATIDQTEIYGDTIMFKDDFTLERGFRIRTQYLDRSYDLNDDILNPIRFFARLLVHLNNAGWNWRDGMFLDTLLNEWNSYGLYRYGGWSNGKFNKP